MHVSSLPKAAVTLSGPVKIRTRDLLRLITASNFTEEASHLEFVLCLNMQFWT